MSATKEFDPEIWKRNLRAAPGAPLPDDDACTRWFNNYFVFWLVCETKARKRTSRCAGDAAACRDRYMPLVPQRMKFKLRAALKAVNDELSPDAVKQQVDEEMTRFDEVTRVLERLGLNGASALRKLLFPLSLQGRGWRAAKLRAGRGSSWKEAPSPRRPTAATLSRKRERGKREGPRVRSL